MKCTICKHGNTKPGKMTAKFERKDAEIAVKQVPADICENCGEAYLSQEIAATLLNKANESANSCIKASTLLWEEV